METTILNTVLSESWIVAGLFLIMLYWTYKLAKWFLWRYLEMSQEHNKSFLCSFDKMVDKVWDLADNVIQGNSQHSKEHHEIAKWLKSNNEISQKINANIIVLHEDIKTFRNKIKCIK